MPSTPSRRRGDGIVDVPAQLLERHVGGLGGDEADLAAVIGLACAGPAARGCRRAGRCGFGR